MAVYEDYFSIKPQVDGLKDTRNRAIELFDDSLTWEAVTWLKRYFLWFYIFILAGVREKREINIRQTKLKLDVYFVLAAKQNYQSY